MKNEIRVETTFRRHGHVAIHGPSDNWSQLELTTQPNGSLDKGVEYFLQLQGYTIAEGVSATTLKAVNEAIEVCRSLRDDAAAIVAAAEANDLTEKEALEIKPADGKLEKTAGRFGLADWTYETTESTVALDTEKFAGTTNGTIRVNGQALFTINGTATDEEVQRRAIEDARMYARALAGFAEEMEKELTK